MAEKFGAPLFDTAGPEQFQTSIRNIGVEIRKVQDAFVALDAKGSPALDNVGKRLDALINKASTLGKKMQDAMGAGSGGGTLSPSRSSDQSFPPGLQGSSKPAGFVSQTTSGNGGAGAGGSATAGNVDHFKPMAKPPPAAPVDTFSTWRAIGGGFLAATGGAARMLGRSQEETLTSDYVGNRLSLGNGAYSSGKKRATERRIIFGSGGYTPTGFDDRADLSQSTLAMQGIAGSQEGTKRFSDIARQRDLVAIAGNMSSVEAGKSIQGYYGASQFYRSLSYGLKTSVGVGGRLGANPYQMAEEVSRRSTFGGQRMTSSQLARGMGHQNLIKAFGGDEAMVQAQTDRLKAAAGFREAHQGREATEKDINKILGDTGLRGKQQRAEGAAKRRAEGEIGSERITQKFDTAVGKFDTAVSRLLRAGHIGEAAGMGRGALGVLARPAGAIGRAKGAIGTIKKLGNAARWAKGKFGGANGGAPTEVEALASEEGAGALGESAGALGAGEAGAASMGGLAAAGGVVVAAGVGYAIGTGIYKTGVTHSMEKGLGRNRAFTALTGVHVAKSTQKKYKGHSVWYGKRNYSVDSPTNAYPYGSGPYPELRPPQTGDSGQPAKGGSGNTVGSLEGLVNSLGQKYIVTATTGGKHATNSYHYKGEAIDITDAPGASDSAGMLALAKGLASKYGAGLSELIYSGGGGVFIKDGKPVSSSVYSGVLAEHHNHVHVAASPDQLSKVGALSGMDAGTTGSGTMASGSTTATTGGGGGGGGISMGGGGSHGEGHDYHEALGGRGGGGISMGGGATGKSNGGAGGNTTNNAGGATSSPSGPPPPGNVASWVKAGLSLAGKDSAANEAAMGIIVMGESGGNPKSQNNYDSNAKKGTPSKGIAQTIDSTFKEHMIPGHGDIWNPVDDIAAATGYAIGRYGSLQNVPGVKAVMAGKKYVGYDRGTYNVDSDQMAMLHKGEMVVRSGDAAMSRQRAGKGGGGGGVNLIFQPGSVVVQGHMGLNEAEKTADMIMTTIKNRAQRELLGST